MKPRSPKPPPPVAASDDPSALSLLRKIQSGGIHPSNLSPENRQALVEHLTAEGYSVAEIGEILKTSERTIARDRKNIRAANAIVRDPVLVEQTVGQLFHEAQNCICRIRRAARDKDATPAVRVDAEHRVYQIFSDQIQRMQGLGYLPSVGQKISAELTHHLPESNDPEVLQLEILRVLEIGASAIDPNAPSSDASPLNGLGKILQLLPPSSSSNSKPPTPQENPNA